MRDITFWKLNLEANIEGADLKNLSAKAFCKEENDRDDDLIPLHGGYPALFQKLYKNSKAPMLLNTRVKTIDMTGSHIIIKTENSKNPHQTQIFQARKVICSLPLGILQKGKVKFEPKLV